jgi:hypothetical protein
MSTFKPEEVTVLEESGNAVRHRHARAGPAKLWQQPDSAAAAGAARIVCAR